MLAKCEGRVVRGEIGDVIDFGRLPPAQLVLGDNDPAVSRRAGRIAFRNDAWVVTNTGSRPFWVVAPNGEFELNPAGTVFETRLLHHFSWIRYPGTDGTYAVVLSVPDHELPQGRAPLMAGGTEATRDQLEFSITDNELRTMQTVYRNYLRLPPHYDRRPQSFRAASVTLGVEENKVKSDHRRVVEKVAASGGPANGTTNRDGLVAWLLSREILTFEAQAELDALEDVPPAS